MTVAVLSTTSCVDIDMEQLEILKDQNAISNFEISHDKTSITLYWTYLKKDETKSVDLTMVKKFGGVDEKNPAICQRRDSQAYIYYQDEDKVWVKDEYNVKAKCDVKTFDYDVKKPIVPDPTDPKPVRPEPDNHIFDLKQKVALMVMDAAPMGRAAALAPAPKRNAKWVAKMMGQEEDIGLVDKPNKNHHQIEKPT